MRRINRWAAWNRWWLIGQGEPQPVGRPVRGLAHQVENAGVGLADDGVGRQGAVGAGREQVVMTEAADRGVNEPGVGRAELRPAEAQPFQHPWAEVLDQHVRAGHQPAQQVAPGLVLEVDGDALLVAIQAQEVHGHASPLVAHDAAFLPVGVAPVGAFYLNDLGAQVGQQHGAGRAADHLGEVKHTDPGQRAAGAQPDHLRTADIIADRPLPGLDSPKTKPAQRPASGHRTGDCLAALDRGTGPSRATQSCLHVAYL